VACGLNMACLWGPGQWLNGCLGIWLWARAWALAIYLYIGYGQKVGLAIWHGLCYIWLVGLVVAVCYIGMVIGVIGKYVYLIFFIRVRAKVNKKGLVVS